MQSDIFFYENYTDNFKNIDALRLQKSREMLTLKDDMSVTKQKVMSYYYALKNTNIESDDTYKEYLEILLTMREYIDIACEEIGNNSAIHACNPYLEHKINEDLKYNGRTMKNIAAGFPLVELNEIKTSLKDLVDFPSVKAAFILLGSIFTLLFGAFNVLHWVLFVVTVVHFFTRFFANKYKKEVSYIRISRNFQLFIWTYIQLLLCNVLCKFITINGLPEGTFISACFLLLIYAEGVGIIENAKIAKLPVPDFLKSIFKKRKKGSPNFPF